MSIQKKFEVKMRDIKNAGERIPKSYIMLGLQFGLKKNSFRNKEIPDPEAKNVIKRLIKDFGENPEFSVSERNEEISALKELIS